MTQAAPAIAGTDREYETIYILRPDIDQTGAEQISQRVREVIEREGARLTRVENWGRRRLAYPVAKHKRGVYVYVRYVGRGNLVPEVERNLKMLDPVLKYQTVKLRDGIVAEGVEVKPEDVKFEYIEVPVDEEPDESPARALGLEEGRAERVHPRAPESDAPESDDEMEVGGDEDEEETP